MLQNAGAFFPARDEIDKRIVEETRTGTASSENLMKAEVKVLSILRRKSADGPLLKSEEPPVDSDHDGMPDEWENANELNPEDSEDRNILNEFGYTMLEVYINGLINDNPTNIAAEENTILSFNLKQNYPNPFNPETTIKEHN